MEWGRSEIAAPIVGKLGPSGQLSGGLLHQLEGATADSYLYIYTHSTIDCVRGGGFFSLIKQVGKAAQR